MEDNEITVAWPSLQTAVVTLVGGHDFWSAPLLRHALDQAARSASCAVVDLRGSTFVDSLTLAELADAGKRHPWLSIHLVVARGSHVDGILRIVRYHKRFECHETLAAALEVCSALTS